jgi:hypothetical protein
LKFNKNHQREDGTLAQEITIQDFKQNCIFSSANRESLALKFEIGISALRNWEMEKECLHLFHLPTIPIHLSALFSLSNKDYHGPIV